MSKKEGGEWALINFPTKFHDIIGNALAVYVGAEEIKPCKKDVLHDIVEYARDEINHYLDRHD